MLTVLALGGSAALALSLPVSVALLVLMVAVGIGFTALFVWVGIGVLVGHLGACAGGRGLDVLPEDDDRQSGPWSCATAAATVGGPATLRFSVCGCGTYSKISAMAVLSGALTRSARCLEREAIAARLSVAGAGRPLRVRIQLGDAAIRPSSDAAHRRAGRQVSRPCVVEPLADGRRGARRRCLVEPLVDRCKRLGDTLRWSSGTRLRRPGDRGGTVVHVLLEDAGDEWGAHGSRRQQAASARVLPAGPAARGQGPRAGGDGRRPHPGGARHPRGDGLHEDRRHAGGHRPLHDPASRWRSSPSSAPRVTSSWAPTRRPRRSCSPP